MKGRLRLYYGSEGGNDGTGTNSRRKEDASVETAYGFEIGFIISYRVGWVGVRGDKK